MPPVADDVKQSKKRKAVELEDVAGQVIAGQQVIEFIVKSRPLAKKALHISSNGRVISRSRPAMNHFKDIAVHLAPPPPSPWKDEVELNAIFAFKIPNKKRKNMERLPVAGETYSKKPDLDNLVKFVGDALTGHYYVDDDQVVFGNIKNVWADSYSTTICLKNLG